MDIRGKVVFVTGSNRGLGKALVTALINNGASKVYAGAREITGLDVPGSQPIELDITDPVSVDRAARQCCDVDVLINNASVLTEGSLLSAGCVESARDHFETNVIGTLLMAKAFAPNLAKRGGGAIINILSVQSWVTAENNGAYSASKAAQWSLTNGLRNELRSQNTFVLGVHPTHIDTECAVLVEGEKTTPSVVADITIYALAEERLEIMIDDAGRRVKYSLSDADAIYLRPMI